MASFPKDDLIALTFGMRNGGGDGLRCVSDEITGQRRWTTMHRMVFTDGTSFYEALYEVGSTESQDDEPFQYEADPVECSEVVPVERTVTLYELAAG